jgi:hypothetical protein
MKNESRHTESLIKKNPIIQFVEGTIFWGEIIDKKHPLYGKQLKVKLLGILYREFDSCKAIRDIEYFGKEQLKIFREVKKEEIYK